MVWKWVSIIVPLSPLMRRLVWIRSSSSAPVLPATHVGCLGGFNGGSKCFFLVHANTWICIGLCSVGWIKAFVGHFVRWNDVAHSSVAALGIRLSDR